MLLLCADSSIAAQGIVEMATTAAAATAALPPVVTVPDELHTAQQCVEVLSQLSERKHQLHDMLRAVERRERELNLNLGAAAGSSSEYRYK